MFPGAPSRSDAQFPTPQVENVYKEWKPVDFGHPLRDATLYYAPPSLERVHLVSQHDVLILGCQVLKLRASNERLYASATKSIKLGLYASATKSIKLGLYASATKSIKLLIWNSNQSP